MKLFNLMDPAHIPLSPPPPGVTSNFVNPVSQAKALKSVSLICMVFMSVSFAMRMYARLWIKRVFQKDDFACLLAVAGTIAYTVISWLTLPIIGKHQWDVVASKLNTYFVILFIIGLEMGYNIVIFFVKLTFFILYFDLFRVSRRIRIFVYIGIASIFTVYAGTTIVYGVSCFPTPGKTWLEAMSDPRCVAPSQNVTYIVGSFGVISDFYILSLPIPLILRMQLPRKEKIGVCALFMTGFLACISSILGLYFRVRASKSQDGGWDLAFTGIVVIVELTVGIVCSCLPVMPPIFRKQNQALLPFAKARPNLSFQNTFHRMKNRPSNNVQLETRILESEVGVGRFLGTRDFPLPLKSSPRTEDLMETDDTSQRSENISKADYQEHRTAREQDRST